MYYSRVIQTLITDVQNILKRKDGWLNDELAKTFATETTQRLKAQFTERQEAPTLRLSKMGDRCPKALWYSIHHPELEEPLPPWAENKFAFGHIVEAWAITLAKATGHKVEGEQDALNVDGVKGHRDCVLDGCVVDVKSCSSRVYQKIKSRQLAMYDAFGYLDQLDGYLVGSAEDPLVTNKEVGYIWAIDKQLGHMWLYEHHIRKARIITKIAEHKRIVGQPSAPSCTCGTVHVGKSGNIGLDTRASYSAFKHSCFPNLRTFIYADGPVYLTHVARKPDVPELDREGRIVYK